jgi:putative transposase
MRNRCKRHRSHDSFRTGHGSTSRSDKPPYSKRGYPVNITGRVRKRKKLLAARKRRQGRLGNIRHLDEVFIRINGQQQYLWRAVDQDGDVIDFWFNRSVISSPRNDSFFEGYCTAREENRFTSLPTNSEATRQRCERSYQVWLTARNLTPTISRSLASTNPPIGNGHAPIQVCWPRATILSLHGVVQNFFRVGRHLLSSPSYRLLRSRFSRPGMAVPTA